MSELTDILSAKFWDTKLFGDLFIMMEIFKELGERGNRPKVKDVIFTNYIANL